MDDKKYGFNINSFIKGHEEYKNPSIAGNQEATDSGKKRRVSKVKMEKEGVEAAPVVQQTPQQVTSLSYIQNNIPYAEAYRDTMGQLDESIGQLNALGGEIVTELHTVRASRQLKNKYGIITEMTGVAANIVSSKINAIKEKNKIISDINNTELKRMKEMKSQANEQDDNMRIANLYDAFVNTPIGVGPAGLGPSMPDMMMAGSALPRVGLGNDHQVWEQNLDPAKRRMLLDAQGTIDTVVVYDAATGNRFYDVIDKTTGQSVPGVEKPSDSNIYDLDINQRGGFAKDINRGVTYPLIVINGGSTMGEY